MLKYSSLNIYIYIFGCLGNILTIVGLSRIRCQEWPREKNLIFFSILGFLGRFCVEQKRLLGRKKERRGVVPFKFTIERLRRWKNCCFTFTPLLLMNVDLIPVFCPRTFNLIPPKSFPSLGAAADPNFYSNSTSQVFPFSPQLKKTNTNLPRINF